MLCIARVFVMQTRLTAILSCRHKSQASNGNPDLSLEVIGIMVRNIVTRWNRVKISRSSYWITLLSWSLIRFSGLWCSMFSINTSREICHSISDKRSLSSWIPYLPVSAVTPPQILQTEVTDRRITKVIFAALLNRENRIKKGRWNSLGTNNK